MSQPKRERANFIEKQGEDEPTLLMTEACGILQITRDTSRQVLHNEEKVWPSLGSDEKKSDCGWYLDTGASNRMTGAKEVFAELDETVGGTVKFGDGSVVDICGRGNMIFQCKNLEHKMLTEVYYIPQLRSNILSLGQLDENGCKIVVEDGNLTIFDCERRLLAEVLRYGNRLYVLDLHPTKPVCLLTKGSSVAWRWHNRFGHLNFRALRSFSQKEMVKGLPQIDHVEQICEGCLVGKQQRKPFPQSSLYRAEELLELVHGDLCGPITPETLAGNQHFLLLVHDCSRHMWVVMLKKNDQSLDAFKKIKARIEVETNIKLKAFRSDRGGEFN